MKKFIIASLTFVMLSTGCNSNTWDVTSDLAVDKEDPTTGLTPLAEQEGNDYAPLYWSVYGALRQQEKDGSFPNIFTEEDWDKAIDYVATNLKPYGYDMLVTDGFASMSGDNGYMTRYSRTKKDENSSEVELTTIIAKLKAKGLKLGVYDSPFWLHYTNPDASFLAPMESRWAACATIRPSTPTCSTPPRTTSSAGLSPHIPAPSSFSRASSSTIPTLA